LRGESCDWSKPSFARKIGLPFATISGPPPSALTTPSQVGFSAKRTVTVVPTGASAASFAAAEPRACSTAPSGGTGVEPDVDDTCATTPVRSVFGFAPGKGWRTASTACTPGVTGPHVGVKSETPFGPGSSLNWSVRRCPLPIQ
jgi:hypothetical protein